MSTQQEAVGNVEAVKTAYTEACSWYHRIDDFRAKLLGFLPLASAGGIFLLLDSNNVSPHLPAIGLFGFGVTLGLLFYELRGIQRCIRLKSVATELEEVMHVHGPFERWPHSLFRFINEPIASGIVYSMVLGAWTYVALFSISSIAACVAAFAFILIGFISVWRFYSVVTSGEANHKKTPK